MKRILSILLALCMLVSLFTLVSCEKSEKNDDDALTLSRLSERFLINMTGINTTKLDFYKNML